MLRVTPEAITSRIRAVKTRSGHAALLAWLSDVARTDSATLTDLVCTGHPEVQFYLVRYARDYAGPHAGDVLEAAARAGSGRDIREEAIEGLAEVAPDRARAFLRVIRQGVRPDRPQPLESMWQLLRVKDRDSIGRLRAVIDARGEHDFRSRVAQIVIAGLEGHDDWIAARLLGHEHIETAWLARAATIIASPRLLEALRLASTSLPDPSCQEEARRELAAWLEGRTWRVDVWPD